MYNVQIPSIEDDDIKNYLIQTKQVRPWERKKSGNITSTRPTYKELIEEVAVYENNKYIWKCKWDNDAVFYWTEQSYNERGRAVGKAYKKMFSVHAYGRMLHNINPQRNILKELNSIRGIDGGFNSTYTDASKKAYVDKHIETPDILFRNMVDLTFDQYELKENIDEKRDTPLQQLNKALKNEATRRVIKRVQPILSDMLHKHSTLVIHINIESALRISNSYRIRNVKGKVKHQWDKWYIRHLLYFAPFFFQRPYYSKYRDIKEEDNVYLYHMFTYQTKYRDGDLWALSNGEIRELCGEELDRIRELTPRGQRIPFNRLPDDRRLLVRQAFGELEPTADPHVQFVGVIMARWIDRGYDNFAIKMQPLKEYRKLFDEEFHYRLSRTYILNCIEKKMNDVEWWDDEDMSRLRQNSTVVPSFDVVKRESIPLAPPPVPPAPPKKTNFNPENYNSGSDDSAYESDSGDEEVTVRKKFNPKTYKSDSDSDGSDTEYYTAKIDDFTTVTAPLINLTLDSDSDEEESNFDPNTYKSDSDDDVEVKRPSRRGKKKVSGKKKGRTLKKNNNVTVKQERRPMTDEEYKEWEKQRKKSQRTL
mgnify:CR=1 FL=1|tara:strand:- start:107 stop:1879 length:1773 start_codon:yes stop_codon:yes gene_type:complete